MYAAAYAYIDSAVYGRSNTGTYIRLMTFAFFSAEFISLLYLFIVWQRCTGRIRLKSKMVQ